MYTIRCICYPSAYILLDVMCGWMSEGWMDGWMSWMDGCSWPCHPPLSSHLHDIVRCDGWMHGCVDGHGLVTFHYPPMYICDEWADVNGLVTCH